MIQIAIRNRIWGNRRWLPAIQMTWTKIEMGSDNETCIGDMNIKISIKQDEDGWFIVTVPALPGCISQGSTESEAKINIAEAIELHLRALAR
jgi:predicted RNase H-like HicB family nuclease